MSRAGPPRVRWTALLAAALLPALACGGADGDGARTEAAPPPLTRLFTVDSLRGPESVTWDGARDRYLITNVAGEPAAEDGNGFITSVSRSGDTVRRRALTGSSLGASLDGPKGIDVRGDRAWVADVHRVVGIDLRADTAVSDLRIPESGFLNDVAVGRDGSVYVSDTDRGAIFRVAPDGGDWARTGAAGSLRSPNGLHFAPDGPGLLVAGWEGAVLRLNPDSSVTLLADPPEAGNLDGIQPAGEDRLLYSDFSRGTVHALHRRRPGHWQPSAPWLEGLTTPADFLRHGRRLAVPELEADRVLFYRVGEVGSSP